MKILALVVSVMLSAGVAFAQPTIVESTVVSLYRGTSKVSDQPSWEACQARARVLANASTQTSGTVTYSCKTEVRKVVASYAPAPPPPPPPAAFCADGLDNDGDGLIDIADPGCAGPTDNDETNVVVPPPPVLLHCADSVDNDNDGLVDLADPGCTSASDNDETNVVVPPPPPPPTGDAVVLFDPFEYPVSRTDPNASNLFLAAGRGWTHVKTLQNSPGAGGFLYTTNSFSGIPPSPAGGRYLMMEALPSTHGGQTDFYMGMGNDVSSSFDDTIPGDVWIQFWTYVLDDPAHPSSFGTRDKFLYPCNTGYGCHSHLWMVMADSATYRPDNMFPLGTPSRGGFFWVNRQSDGVSQIVNTTGDPDAPGNIGPTNLSEWNRPNRWVLVKMHFNTTRTTGNSWEVWLKTAGAPFTKVVEWIGGVTPGFTWNIPAASVGGHRVMRMPSTVSNDFWMALDDFTIARTETALTIYP